MPRSDPLLLLIHILFLELRKKNLPHNSVQQNKRKSRGRKKKQRDKKILNRNRTHHDLLSWNYCRRHHLVQTPEKSSAGVRQWQRCSCRLNLNKA